MIKAELIAETIQRRLVETTGVNRCVRNPETAPNPEDYPAIHIWERAARATSFNGRGETEYKWRGGIGLELFVRGTTEHSASKELRAFQEEVIGALFPDGVSFIDDLCEMRRTQDTDVAVVTGNGQHVRGIGMIFDLLYAE